MLIVIIILVLLLSLSFSNKNYKLNMYSDYLMNNKIKFNNKIAIILTANSRNNLIEQYYNNIKLWLETGYDIYFLDSSTNFISFYKHFDDYKNYHKLFFDQNNYEWGKNNSSSSILEINSLKLIFEKFNFEKYHFIFKITAKYYFDINNTLKSINLKDNNILYVQKNNKTKFLKYLFGGINWQSSEIFCTSPHIFKELIINYLNINNNYLILEEYLANLDFNIKKFKKIKILSKPIKRGDGKILKYL